MASAVLSSLFCNFPTSQPHEDLLPLCVNQVDLSKADKTGGINLLAFDFFFKLSFNTVMAISEVFPDQFIVD